MDRRTFSLLSLGSLPLALPALTEARAEPAERTPSTALGRASTFSQVGKELRPFVERAEGTLAEEQGSGYLDHMWFGGDFANFRGLRLRIYVDGETVASIDAELGLAVGVGFADPAAPWGTAWAGITGAPSGIFLNYRIPFSKSIRVTAELPEGVARDMVFWWIVRGLKNYPLEVSGIPLPSTARLRLHKQESLHAEPEQIFDLCKVTRDGMVFQVTMQAQSTNFEFMEGQMRAYIGGATEPQMLSSGLEDYFLGTYYFNRGLYHLPQAGLTHKDETNFTFSAYRFHDIDPLLFAGGVRLACRCGEMLGNKIAGPTGKPMATTYTTYAWVYEW